MGDAVPSCEGQCDACSIGEARGVPAPSLPPLGGFAGAGAKPNASCEESYVLVGVGVFLGELDELVLEA